MTRTIAGTVPDGQTHLIFAVYVCEDTVLVTYNTAQVIVRQKKSMREASRTQTTQENEEAGRSGYAGIYIPFSRLPLVTVNYTSVTFVIFVRGSEE